MVVSEMFAVEVLKIVVPPLQIISLMHV